MKLQRKVMVLHKCTDDKKRDTLAVGKTFTFPGSQDSYTVQSTGAVVNAQPRPWKNKAERKRLRREARAARNSVACSS